MSVVAGTTICRTQSGRGERAQLALYAGRRRQDIPFKRGRIPHAGETGVGKGLEGRQRIGDGKTGVAAGHQAMGKDPVAAEEGEDLAAQTFGGPVPCVPTAAGC